MSTKPKFFLLDAGPIIELHRIGLWRDVLDRADIVVPRVIAEKEAEYWVREDNSRRPIDVLGDAESGRLTIRDCDEAELRETLELFDRAVQQSVDPGELHALALIRRWQGDPVPAFCSADRMAIVCLCLLGFSDAAASLEELLRAVGFTVRLGRRFTTAKMTEWVADGRRRSLQDSGLA
jgi:hypothetical protein